MSRPEEPISLEQLVDLAEGRLSAAEAETLRARLVADASAAAELAWLQRVIGLMRSDDSEDPPLHVVNRALRLFRSQPAPAQPGLLQRVLAVLQFDSLTAQPAFGVRSGQTGLRQVLYQAAGRDLDLRIVTVAAGWQVTGQVLGADEPGEVELRGANGTAHTQLNEVSEFELAPVPAGVYRLTLRQGELEIVIEELILGTPAE